MNSNLTLSSLSSKTFEDCVSDLLTRFGSIRIEKKFIQERLETLEAREADLKNIIEKEYRE